ncbi:helix-turn-helix domain-containing protein [Sphaerisporangium siamense]|uniref:Transcriptional regulator with XRE-family HTH domain n=1 Tax=Sphaerisporangium siamense TaxID=795645 RepID=A0A7W7D8Y3_9ACTN|nr:helix-turn-helix transcriptional regulator [Sphaerisporangium siamense]MBB4702184.1 transcriptional regulator with XRE-family HTH domain [Sphaerisporangium siamense]
MSNMAAQTGPFGAWIRAAMNARGYTERGALTRFAREAGVNKSTVSRAINEGVIPDLSALRGMGRVLGHTLGEMLVHAGLATAEELPVRASLRGDSASLADALGELRESAAGEGKTIGEMLIAAGLASREELSVPPALPPDPIIAEIEASDDISEETKANIIAVHLEHRARRFEEARLKRERNKRPDE